MTEGEDVCRRSLYPPLGWNNLYGLGRMGNKALAFLRKMCYNRHSTACRASLRLCRFVLPHGCAIYGFAKMPLQASIFASLYNKHSFVPRKPVCSVGA
jgi:hypothetical protein